MASQDDLYASSLIREIVEVYVIEHETRNRTYESSTRQKNAEKLREELIKLNESIIKITGVRDKMAMRLRQAAEREIIESKPEDDDGGDSD